MNHHLSFYFLYTKEAQPDLLPLRQQRNRNVLLKSAFTS